MGNPRVSIILLNWNGLEVTIDCLESLKNISYPNYEVIVVDNASSGNDVEALNERFGDYIHIIKNDMNYGFAEGNNIGIRHALINNPDYVLMLNNDTVVAPDFLSELVKVTQTDARIGVSAPKIYFYDEPEKLGHAGRFINYWTCSMRDRGARQIDHGQFEDVIEVDYASGCCMLISRQVLQNVGLLDSRFFFGGGEDVDICTRAAKHGFRTLFAPKSKIWHKASSSSRMNKTRSQLYSYYIVRNRFILMEKHCTKLQFITSTLCFIVYLPKYTLRALRCYSGWDIFRYALLGLWDYFTKNIYRDRRRLKLS